MKNYISFQYYWCGKRFQVLNGVKRIWEIMIRVLFICHGRIRTFVWSGLKSRLLGNENGICTSPLSPYFARVYRDNLKAKLSGWNLLTGLSSIKMNMICGERSSCGEERNAGRMLWCRWTDFEKLCINFLYR